VSEVKILKITEGLYTFYHGQTCVGRAEYENGQFFFRGGSHGCNESLLMGVVIIMRELDSMKNGVDQYLLDRKELRELGKKKKKRKA